MSMCPTGPCRAAPTQGGMPPAVCAHMQSFTQGFTVSSSMMYSAGILIKHFINSMGKQMNEQMMGALGDE